MKKNIKTLLLLIVFGGIFLIPIQAQKNKKPSTTLASGFVMDDAGNPISGLLLTAYNSHKSTVTDSQGKFEIEVQLNDFLGVDIEGLEPSSHEVSFGKLSNDTIIMQRTSFFNEKESVDIPFGSVSMNRSTGSVIRISGEQLQRQPSGIFTEALSGLIPGLMISQVSSRPGYEGFNMTYHGHSIEVLVDGVPQATQISLREIDEVVFMRGASATAYMGDMGANGLLLVKTKRGMTGTRKMSFEYETGSGTPTVMGEFMNAYDYANEINKAWLSDGHAQPYYSNEALSAYQNGTDPIRYPDVNYFDEFLRNNVNRNQFNAQASGGTKNSRYFMNIAYSHLNGLEKLSEKRKNDDLSFRSNIDLNLSEDILLDAALTGTYQKQRTPRYATGSMFNVMSTYAPNSFPLMLGDSIYITSQDRGTNLLFELSEGGYVEQTDMRMALNAGLSIDMRKIVKGLSFKTRGSLDLWNQMSVEKDHNPDEYELIFTTNESGNDTMLIHQTVVGTTQLNPSDNGESVYRKYNFYGVFSYDNTFDKHAITTDLAYYYNSYEMEGRLSINTRQMINLRANYAFANTYALEGILSYVGSNKLYNNRYKLFPTIGASWIVSNESAFKDSESINYLKVRGSYGQQGYMTTSNYYTFWDNWASDGNVRFGTYPTNNQTTATFTKDQTGNPDLEWPVKSTFNIGTDAILFKRSLAVQFDYFYSKTSGMLDYYQYPDMAGGSGFYAYYNLEEVSGNGIELALTYNKTLGDFSYSLGLNGGYFKEINKLLSEPDYTDAYRKREGAPSDAIYGLDADGLFTSDEEALSTNQNFGSTYAGDIRYLNHNSDETVNENDVHEIGNSNPRFMYGININLAYKGFSLYANGSGLGGYDININGDSFYQPEGFDNRSTIINSNLPNGNAMTRSTILGSSNNYRNSTYWLVDGGFFRLKNVELAYTLPSQMLQKTFISSTKFYVRGKNMLTFSAFQNRDPEMLDGGYTDYPIFRELSAGVILKF